MKSIYVYEKLYTHTQENPQHFPNHYMILMILYKYIIRTRENFEKNIYVKFSKNSRNFSIIAHSTVVFCFIDANKVLIEVFIYIFKYILYAAYIKQGVFL